MDELDNVARALHELAERAGVALVAVVTAPCGGRRTVTHTPSRSAVRIDARGAQYHTRISDYSDTPSPQASRDIAVAATERMIDDLAQAAAEIPRPTERIYEWERSIRDIRSVFAARLTAEGAQAALANRYAYATVDELCLLHGGVSLYIPTRARVQLADRNRLMRKAWTGKNLRDVARLGGVSVRQARNIVICPRAAAKK